MALALLAFWLQAAPDLRFGSGLFWIWFALGSSLLAAALPPLPGWILIAAAGVSFGFAPVRELPARVAQSPWIWGQAHTLRVTAVTVNAQEPPLQVYIPVAGDQCGDAPLPATPYPSPRLLARRPGDLSRGFRRPRRLPRRNGH
jgi:hypothetical protein